jgi:transcriptional regulator with XRE-family HTH domain
MDEQDPGLVVIGQLLRALRLANNKMTQSHLARLIGCAEGTISGVETGQEWPSRGFLGRCDKALNTGGALVSAYDLVKGTASVHPIESFEQFRREERRAIERHEYEVTVIPGLLQTEDYARALIAEGPPISDPDKIDEIVAERMERQQILNKSPQPLLLVVIDEAALERQVGGREMRRTQLDRLIEMAGRPRTTLQIIPQAAGAHAGLNCSFTILGFIDGPSIAYTEDPACGHLHERPELVRKLYQTFDALRAKALPVDESMRLFQKLREEL